MPHRPHRDRTGRRLHAQHQVQPPPFGGRVAAKRRVETKLAGGRPLPAQLDGGTAASIHALSQAAGFAVPVFSALVFVDPASLTIEAPPGWDGTDLHVVSDDELLALLTRLREISDEQLATVMDAALRAETWHRSPQPSCPRR